jgi:hypothetical protein
MAGTRPIFAHYGRNVQTITLEAKTMVYHSALILKNDVSS